MIMLVKRPSPKALIRCVGIGCWLLVSVLAPGGCSTSRENKAAQAACQCMNESVALLADSTLTQLRAVRSGKAMRPDDSASSGAPARATERVGKLVQRCFDQAGVPDVHGRTGPDGFSRARFRRALQEACGGIRGIVDRQLAE